MIRVKRLDECLYQHCGFKIKCYYNDEPKGRDIWECTNLKTYQVFGYWFTLREAKKAIDQEITDSYCRRKW